MHYTRCCLSLLKKIISPLSLKLKSADTARQVLAKGFHRHKQWHNLSGAGESGMAADFIKRLFPPPTCIQTTLSPFSTIAASLLEEGKNDEAYSLLHSNIDNLRQLQASPWEVTFHTIRSQVEEAAGNPEVALEALKASIATF